VLRAISFFEISRADFTELRFENEYPVDLINFEEPASSQILAA